MNFAQAFTYVFEDPDWTKKLLIPALVALIPLIGQIVVIGWMLELTRNVIQRSPRPLPNLDFGRQLGEGFKGIIISLVYTIPIIILVIPIIIVSTMLTGQDMDAGTATTLITVVSLCFGGLIFLYSILMAFVLPAAFGNYAASGNLGAAFRFQEVFGLLRAAPGAYLLALLGIIVAGFVAGLGTIVCVIGMFATLVYSQAIMGHLYGQAYLEGTKNKGYASPYAY